MANNRKLLADQDIVMNKIYFKPYGEVSLTDSIKKIAVSPLTSSLDDLTEKVSRIDLQESFRSPKHRYENVGATSLHEASLGFLPSELWVAIYHLLDVKSALQLSMVCRILSEIANDNALREKIYREKHNIFRHLTEQSLLSEYASLNNKLLNTIPNYHLPLFAHQRNFEIRREREIYNDQPEGLGFVIKNNY